MVHQIIMWMMGQWHYPVRWNQDTFFEPWRTMSFFGFGRRTKESLSCTWCPFEKPCHLLVIEIWKRHHEDGLIILAIRSLLKEAIHLTVRSVRLYQHHEIMKDVSYSTLSTVLESWDKARFADKDFDDQFGYVAVKRWDRDQQMLYQTAFQHRPLVPDVHPAFLTDFPQIVRASAPCQGGLWFWQERRRRMVSRGYSCQSFRRIVRLGLPNAWAWHRLHGGDIGASWQTTQSHGSESKFLSFHGPGFDLCFGAIPRQTLDRSPTKCMGRGVWCHQCRYHQTDPCVRWYQ